MSDDLNTDQTSHEPEYVPPTVKATTNGASPPGDEKPTPADDRVDDELGGDLPGFASEEPTSILDDAEELRLDPNEDIQEAVKIHGPVPVRTMPGKQVYFRVMPGDQWRWGTVMCIDEDLGPFIVTKSMRQYVEDVRPYVIVLCITSKGVEFFWPLPLPQEGEHSLSKEWNGSKRRAAALAETKWIKVRSNKPANCWDHFASKGNLDEPRWSGRTFKEMFDSAFADKIIRDVGHPVIKRQQEG
jgi:hypothetical protein